MFSSDSLEILSDGTYFDLNGSIGIIREPNLGQNETEFRSSFCLIFVNTSWKEDHRQSGPSWHGPV